MEATVNIGIIGVGIVGERFLKALRRHGKMKITGVCDTNAERANRIAGQYGVAVFSDYPALLRDESVDLVYLAVPPKHHHAIALDVIRAGKHIICEKPLANSVDEAREMLEAARAGQIVHAMNFPTVYSAGFHRMREYLREGFPGRLRRIELQTYFEQWPRLWQQTDWISSREQGGFVREVFTHYVQMIQMLFGAVSGITSQIEYPDDPAASETGIIATGRLQDGTPVLFNGTSQIGMTEHIALTIYGTEGTLSFVNWRDLWISQKGQRPVKGEVPENDHLVELIDEVWNALNRRDARIVTFQEGYDAQVVIEQLLGRVQRYDG